MGIVLGNMADRVVRSSLHIGQHIQPVLSISYAGRLPLGNRLVLLIRLLFLWSSLVLQFGQSYGYIHSFVEK